MNVQEMTPRQAIVAARMAHVYGHMWAEEMDRIRGLLLIEEIRSVTRGRVAAEKRIGGIDAPQTVGKLVVHTTNSQRLTWSVAPSGAVDILINRPEGPVIHAKISPKGELVSVSGICRRPYGRRHIVALADAWAAAADLGFERPRETGEETESSPLEGKAAEIARRLGFKSGASL